MNNDAFPVTPWFKCNRPGCGWWTSVLELLRNHQESDHKGETMLDVILPTGAVCPQCSTGEGRQRNIYVDGKMGRECTNCQTQWICVAKGSGKHLTVMVPGGVLGNGAKPGGARPGPREIAMKGTSYTCYACGHQWTGSLVSRADPRSCPKCDSRTWNKFKPDRVAQEDKKDGYCFKCKEYRDVRDIEELTANNGRRYRQGLCQECGTKVVTLLGNQGQSAATSL